LALTGVDWELGAEIPPSFSARTRYSYCFFSFTVWSMNSKPFSSKVHLVTKNDEDNGDDGVDNDDDDCNVKVA